MMRKKIRASLVVLSWNGWGLMHRQMMDLNTMMPDDCELVWIDNGSTESGFEQGAKWWVNNFPKELNYFRFEKNQGFQVGNNKGIQLAAGDIVIILNPDVKI
jgi:GT2 family glycosyltransferase